VCHIAEVEADIVRLADRERLAGTYRNISKDMTFSGGAVDLLLLAVYDAW